MIHKRLPSERKNNISIPYSFSVGRENNEKNFNCSQLEGRPHILYHLLVLGMATGRGEYGYHDPILIPIIKIHPHPHLQTQRVYNF